MSTIHVNPFSPQHSFSLPSKLKELDRPMIEVLADFIHGCSPDPSTRTAATTALVLSLWQLAGQALTPQPPSLLLLRPGGGGSDPIDDFIRTLIHNEICNKPRVQTEGAFMHQPINLAPKAMENALRKRHSLGEQIPPDDINRQMEAEAAEHKFRAAQKTAHGYGRSRSYSKAWHPHYGLLTDTDEQLILRLNDDEDRLSFVHDLLKEPEKIVFPRGVGASLFPTAKKISISGALSSELWASKLAGMILSSGMPFFVLPHSADSPLEGNSLNPLRCFASIWQSERLPHVEAALRLPESDWIRRYHIALRKRLNVFPMPALFPTLQAIHQLEEVCKRIVGVALDRTITDDKTLALLHDLYHHTLRGLVIGMASHIWFGVGLIPGEEREDIRKKAARLLRKLRREGPVTKTAILKNLLRNKRDRDAVVDALTELNLIREESSTITAVSYKDFVAGLYASDEFPAVESQWERVTGKKSAKDRESD